MADTRAAALKVLAGGGITGPLNELAPQFERATGRKVVIEYGATPGLIERATSGAPFDLGIAPREVYADANARARFAPAATTEIARAGFGVAVRAGAAKPDIGTADKLRATLLQARSVAFLPASAAGAQVMKVFDTLGIADAMKAKTRAQTTPAAIAAAVANGDAELAVFLINVLMAPGVDVVGPLPAEVQQELVFAAAIAADTREVEAAKMLIAYLTTPAAAAVIRAKGMQPAGGR